MKAGKARAEVKPNQKITSFFSMKSSSPPKPCDDLVTKKPSRQEVEVISVSSTSDRTHISISSAPTTKSHISVSSSNDVKNKREVQIPSSPIAVDSSSPIRPPKPAFRLHRTGVNTTPKRTGENSVEERQDISSRNAAIKTVPSSSPPSGPPRSPFTQLSTKAIGRKMPIVSKVLTDSANLNRLGDVPQAATALHCTPAETPIHPNSPQNGPMTLVSCSAPHPFQNSVAFDESHGNCVIPSSQSDSGRRSPPSGLSHLPNVICDASYADVEAKVGSWLKSPDFPSLSEADVEMTEATDPNRVSTPNLGEGGYTSASTTSPLIHHSSHPPPAKRRKLTASPSDSSHLCSISDHNATSPTLVSTTPTDDKKPPVPPSSDAIPPPSTSEFGETTTSDAHMVEFDIDAHTRCVIAQIKAQAAERLSPESDDSERRRLVKLKMDESSDDDDLLQNRFLLAAPKMPDLNCSPLTEIDSDSDEDYQESGNRSSSRKRSRQASPTPVLPRRVTIANATTVKQCPPLTKNKHDFMSLIDDHKRQLATKKDIPISPQSPGDNSSDEEPFSPPKEFSKSLPAALEEELDLASNLSRGILFWQDTHEQTSVLEEALQSMTNLSCILPKAIWQMIQDNQGLESIVELILSYSSTLRDGKYMRIVESLLNAALSPDDSLMTRAAYQCFMNTPFHYNASTCDFTFSSVLSLLSKMGASHEVCEAFHWDLPNSVVVPVTCLTREIVVTRLINIVERLIGAGAIAINDYPNYIIAFSLIALDNDVSPKMERDCALIISRLLFKLHEEQLLQHVLNDMIPWLSRQSRVIQARAITLFDRGNVATATIARWLSWSVLTGVTFNKRTFAPYPPLEDLLLLICFVGEAPPGAFDIHDETDYIDLVFRTEILSHLLRDLEGYMARPAPSNSFPANSSSNNQNDSSDVSLLIGGLNQLHTQIRDIRASHIDRTRAKDLLRRLAMRLHYQNEAFRKGRSSNRSNLKQWLISRPPVPTS